MKTIFPFQDGKLAVKEISKLHHATQRRFASKYPKATHVVINPQGICYAIAGSQQEAQQALDALMQVNQNE